MKSQRRCHRTPLIKPIKDHACISLAELHSRLWVPKIAAKQPIRHRIGWLQLHSQTDQSSAQVALSINDVHMWPLQNTMLCRVFLSSSPWFVLGSYWNGLNILAILPLGQFKVQHPRCSLKSFWPCIPREFPGTPRSCVTKILSTTRTQRFPVNPKCCTTINDWAVQISLCGPRV